MRPPSRVVCLVVIGAVASVVMAACSSSSSPSTSSSAPKPTATSVPSGSAPSSTATTSPSSTTIPTVPLQTATYGEFLSPTGNIDCSISAGASHQPPTEQVFCATLKPPQSVTMDGSGSLKKCSGPGCGGNGQPGAPTLAYGTGTGAGPFLCVSEVTGMTCTVTGGKGFTLSTAGIKQIG